MDALNQTPSATLEEAQQRNQSARHRLVGLVIETRPDAISPRELARLRRLGVTKVQMGVQSLDERVLELNQRGHSAAEALRACSLLRAAGFKIVLHWMPNLLGATPDSDRTDFQRLFDDGCQPDEIKIYPCQLLENTRLYQIWREGGYTPYTTDELIELVADVKTAIPPWCRVNRVIRDIPSPHVVEGNRRTSLRKDILERLARRGQRCQCLRCREVRGEKVVPGELRLVELNYPAGEAKEVFIQYLTGSDRVAGYLRLSMPGPSSPDLSEVLPDLAGAALIREVHVYGQSLPVGRSDHGAAQHIGLGTGLLRRAEEIALRAGFKRMAVISSVGTRPWYRERGYQLEQTYMTRSLTPTQETGSAG